MCGVVRMQVGFGVEGLDVGIFGGREREDEVPLGTQPSRDATHQRGHVHHVFHQAAGERTVEPLASWNGAEHVAAMTRHVERASDLLQHGLTDVQANELNGHLPTRECVT